MKLSKLTPMQKKLRRRIVEIIYAAKTSHLGSCLNVVDIIAAIYDVKRANEKFVLSSGHAAVALYVVLEKYGILKDPDLKKLHVHPDRDSNFGIDVSSGSLGQGLPIAVGIALANPRHKTFCVISDGECSEGSIWEALRIAQEQKLTNLTIVVNVNGWGGYDKVDIHALKKRIKGFGYQPFEVNGHSLEDLRIVLQNRGTNGPLLIFAKTSSDQLPFLRGLDSLYYLMNELDYKLALKLLE